MLERDDVVHVRMLASVMQVGMAAGTPIASIVQDLLAYTVEPA